MTTIASRLRPVSVSSDRMPRQYVVRGEHLGDQGGIEVVCVRAFHTGHQAHVVDLHRRSPAFDRDLSLVVEHAGQIVGHAMFVPRTIRLLDEDVPAVNLISLAVDPLFQGRGIGSRLVRAGHAIAHDKGASLSFAVGDPAYYCRLGYYSRAFGNATISVPSVQPADRPLSVREVHDDDGLPLRRMWYAELGAVDFSVVPCGDRRDWVSPNHNIAAYVFTRRHEVVGYVRYHIAHRLRPIMFLAASPEDARAMAYWMAQHDSSASARLTLPLHSHAASAPVFGRSWSIAWDSALACSLEPGPFESYYAALQAGRRPPGVLTWPVEFEVE